MKTNITVKDLLTEVGTLVGMYGGEFFVTPTAPAAESVYCEALADNGHTLDSLFERWVVLKGTDGVWRQRVINNFSNNVLAFKHASGANMQLFSHDATDTLFLFDRAAPALVLRAIMPAVESNPHLATLTRRKTIDLKALHEEYIQNQSISPPIYANQDERLNFKDVLTSSVGLSDVLQILEVRQDGVLMPVDYWEWRYFGNGDLADNGLLTIDNRFLMTKIEIVYTVDSTNRIMDITRWEDSVAQVAKRARECLKYHCAARWMQTSLAGRDEEGWNYAKKTETHFRNRAAELEPVLPAVMR